MRLLPCVVFAPFLLPQFSERELAESDRQGAIRAEAVKGAMLHVWSGYREKAWGTDEVKPVSGSGKATWGGALLL
jgi:mannosyl-oligosaccharide alpha-1,2-mannosidase